MWQLLHTFITPFFQGSHRVFLVPTSSSDHSGGGGAIAVRSCGAALVVVGSGNKAGGGGAGSRDGGQVVDGRALDNRSALLHAASCGGNFQMVDAADGSWKENEKSVRLLASSIAKL